MFDTKQSSRLRPQHVDCWGNSMLTKKACDTKQHVDKKNVFQNHEKLQVVKYFSSLSWRYGKSVKPVICVLHTLNDILHMFLQYFTITKTLRMTKHKYTSLITTVDYKMKIQPYHKHSGFQIGKVLPHGFYGAASIVRVSIEQIICHGWKKCPWMYFWA